MATEVFQYLSDVLHGKPMANYGYNLDVCIYVLNESLRKDAEKLKETFLKSVTDCEVKTYLHNPATWDFRRSRLLWDVSEGSGNLHWNISETRQHFIQCKAKKYDVKFQAEQQPIEKLKDFVIVEEATPNPNFTTVTGTIPLISIKSLGDLVDLIMPPKLDNQVNQPQGKSMQPVSPVDQQTMNYQVSASPYLGPDNHHVDVVVIFGHCSMYNSGPFSTDKLLAALTKVKPTIIAFLGCCGGSNRYGPILKMMHALNPKCIVGFYQRRVYVDELHETSLIAGLKNYLYLTSNDPELGKNAVLARFGDEKQAGRFADYKRAIAIHAFGYAQSCLSDEKSLLDPSRFANDNQPNLHQILSKHYKDAVNSTSDMISLACLQFAMYHQMLLNSKMKPIEVSMEAIVKRLPQKYSADQLSKKFMEEIKTHQLHKLIPLICELALLKLYKKSLDLIKHGDSTSWKKVDHLQFLLAMLRGHWGRNTLAVIRKWATFHLMEMMDELKKYGIYCNRYLHKYKLCCVCYALLCEEHFLMFEIKDIDFFSKDIGQLGILACTKLNEDSPEGLVYCVTHDGYIGSSGRCKPRPIMLPHPSGKFSDQGELPIEDCNWTELFQHCDSIPDCVEMYNSSYDENNFMLSQCKQWDIKNKSKSDFYKYNYIDFDLAMIALRHHFLKPYQRTDKKKQRAKSDVVDFSTLFDGYSTSNDRDNSEDTMESHVPDDPAVIANCYHVKKFKNVDDKDGGNMAAFPEEMELEDEQFSEINFMEMRVIIDENLNNIDSLASLCLTVINNNKPHMIDINIGTITSRIFHQINQKELVSACRFIFAKFNNPTIEIDHTYDGILFFTDSHYGHQLIQFDQEANSLLCENCRANKEVVDAIKRGLMKWIPSMDNKCLFKMQQSTITKMKDQPLKVEFPYKNIGRLTLSTNNIELQEAPQLQEAPRLQEAPKAEVL